MKWILITEEKIPNDIETINKSYKKDINTKKYAPTIEFAKYAFKRLNEDLFKSNLSESKVYFKVKPFHERHKDSLGCVIPNKNGMSGNNNKYELYLNTNINLTIHGWFEAVLHEMFHIYEEEYFPENKLSNDYDPHGEWFIAQCERVKSYGFNVASTYNGDFDMDDDSITVKKLKSKYIYLQSGVDEKDNPNLLKILSSEFNDWIQLLYINGYSKAIIWSTDNPNSTKLNPIEFPFKSSNDKHKKLVKPYKLTDEFNEKYGTFIKSEEMEIEDYFNKMNAQTESTSDCVYVKIESKEYPDDDEYMKFIRRKYGDSLMFIEKTDTGYRYGIT